MGTYEGSKLDHTKKKKRKGVLSFFKEDPET